MDITRPTSPRSFLFYVGGSWYHKWRELKQKHLRNHQRCSKKHEETWIKTSNIKKMQFVSRNLRGDLRGDLGHPDNLGWNMLKPKLLHRPARNSWWNTRSSVHRYVWCSPWSRCSVRPPRCGWGSQGRGPKGRTWHRGGFWWFRIFVTPPKKKRDRLIMWLKNWFITTTYHYYLLLQLEGFSLILFWGTWKNDVYCYRRRLTPWKSKEIYIPVAECCWPFMGSYGLWALKNAYCTWFVTYVFHV